MRYINPRFTLHYITWHDHIKYNSWLLLWVVMSNATSHYNAATKTTGHSKVPIHNVWNWLHWQVMHRWITAYVTTDTANKQQDATQANNVLTATCSWTSVSQLPLDFLPLHVLKRESPGCLVRVSRTAGALPVNQLEESMKWTKSTDHN